MSERALASTLEHLRSAGVDVVPHDVTPLQRRQAKGSGPIPVQATGPAPSSAIPIQMFADAVSAGLYPRVVQLDGSGAGLDIDSVHQAAAHGLSGAGGSVPHLAAIQRSFGHHDLTGVQAHIGGRAAEASAAMGAHAYASGNQVAFATSPDLHLAAHELAHVVQQRGGVRLAGGVGRAGDEYERHADAVADMVVQGKSAESLLDTMAHRGATGGSALQLFSSTNPMTSLARLNAVLPTLSSAEATTIANQLQAGIDQHLPLIPLHFVIGSEHYDLVIAQRSARTALTRVTAIELTSTPDATCDPEHAGSEPAPAPPRVLPPVSIAHGGPALVGAIEGITGTMAGPEGQTQEITVNLSPPGPWGMTVYGSLRLRLAHGRVGAATEPGGEPTAATYQLEMELQAGLGVQTPTGSPVAARGRVMVGVRISARGTTPRTAAQMAVLALETQVRGLDADLADALFTHDFHDAARGAMVAGDSAEASGSARFDGRVGSPRVPGGPSAEVAASAGLSEHSMTDVGSDGAVRDRTYVMFDASGSATFRDGDASLQGTIAGHFPVGEDVEGVDPSISIRVRGAVPATGSSAMWFSILSSLFGSLLAQLEAGPEHGDAAARRLRRQQAALREVGALAEAMIQREIHDAASGTIGAELEVTLGHGTPSLVLRLIHTVSARAEGLADFSYDSMTEFPLRCPPGLTTDDEPHFSPEPRR
jgi:hypothetical protein